MTTITDERMGVTSASNAEADSLCPARHLRQRGLPEEESDDAKRGTEIHDALAAGDVSRLPPELRETAERCAEIEAATITRWLAEIGIPNPYCVENEQRYWLHDAEGRKLHSGKVDLAVYAGDHALILDRKTGRAEVAESATNLQLRDLAVLVWMAYKFASVTVAIVQPLAPGGSKPELIRYELTDLMRAFGDMKRRVLRSQTPNQPANPGSVQCRYCRAKGTCPEYHQWLNRSLAVVPVPATVSIEDRQRLLQSYAYLQAAVSEAKRWQSSLIAKAVRESWPEISWEEKPGNREVTDPLAASRRVREVIPPDEVMRLVKIPISAFEALFVERFQEVNPGSKVKDAKAAFAAAVGDAVQRGKPKRKLVINGVAQEAE